MNIDERLEKLTERHEALTQTVEIVAGMQRDNEKRMGALEESMRTLSGTTSRLETSMTTLADTMNRLANIVIRHEERLDALDGGDE